MKKALLLVLLSFAAIGITYAQEASKQLKSYQEPLTPIKVDTSIASLLNGSKLAEKLKNDGAAAQQSTASLEYSSNMPVAQYSIQNLDTMPVAKLGGYNTKYTMMIKRIAYAKRIPSVAKTEAQPNADKEK